MKLEFTESEAKAIREFGNAMIDKTAKETWAAKYNLLNSVMESINVTEDGKHKTANEDLFEVAKSMSAEKKKCLFSLLSVINFSGSNEKLSEFLFQCMLTLGLPEVNYVEARAIVEEYVGKLEF